jgi:LAS superfamily LD-carboxypeptidase LdcB
MKSSHTDMKHYDKRQMASFGLSEDHITWHENIGLHNDVLAPWRRLANAAHTAGFDLALASGFRSFERQQFIWDAKISGQRPVFDDKGHALDTMSLPVLDKIESIMRWSALPGTSRHHWGTDIDIYDRAAVPANYCLQLVAEEYDDSGPFSPMLRWLKDYLHTPDAPAFIFPYIQDNNGVMPEPWHLSYLPVARHYQETWSLELLQEILRDSSILEKKTVLSTIEALYERFVKDSINLTAASLSCPSAEEIYEHSPKISG